jgi:hypothetical protein
MSGVPESGNGWAIYEYAPWSGMTFLRIVMPL